MRVFVTGATGFIGSAVVRNLIAAGHQVVGLARSDRSVASLTAAGAQAHRGDLDDLDSLRAGAAAADGVIHLAFIHDFDRIAASGEVDLRAVAAIGAALEGCGKPFVVTSGSMVVTSGRLATENDMPDPESFAGHRVASENATIALADRGVRSSVVRLPPSVHGSGDYGFIPTLIGVARDKGVSAYVGDGANRWPAVHRLDAAQLFRLAVEAAPAGTRLHGVADEGVALRDIAAVIGRRLDVPVVAIPAEEAVAHFGWLGAFAAVDSPTSSALTRQLLGWQPEQIGLLADLAEGDYFSESIANAS